MKKLLANVLLAASAALLLIASDAVGYAWLYASVVMCAVVAFLPGRWFASRPRGDD